eukprot:164229-Amphidinium_carterae.4
MVTSPAWLLEKWGSHHQILMSYPLWHDSFSSCHPHFSGHILALITLERHQRQLIRSSCYFQGYLISIQLEEFISSENASVYPRGIPLSVFTRTSCLP